MTVASSTDRATFPGNDATTVFPLPFRFFANGEVNAWLITNATGAPTPLTLGTHYTLIGASDPEVDGSATGQLTMLTPPTSAQSLFVQRIIPVTQPTDIVNQGQFFPEIHENVFDRLTMLNQQNAGALNRAIRVQDFDPEPAKLPSAAQRALKIMSFDADGNPVAIDAASDSSLVLRQDLANATDPAAGVSLVARAAEKIVTDLTVNIPSDYATLQQAIDDLSTIQCRQGVTITLMIETGHQLTAGVLVSDGSYNHFKISSFDAQVQLAPGFPFVDVIKGVNAWMPTLDCLIDANSLGDNGYFADQGSRGFVSPGCGVRRCAKQGCYANNASSIFADGSIFTEASQIAADSSGILAWASTISAVGADVRNSQYYGAQAAAGGVLHFRNGIADGALRHGVRATNAGTVNARGASSQNTGVTGFRAFDTGVIHATDSNASGSLSNAYQAENGGTITADNVTADAAVSVIVALSGSRITSSGGVLSGGSIRSDNASVVNLQTPTITNTGGRALSAVSGGSILVQGGSITGGDADRLFNVLDGSKVVLTGTNTTTTSSNIAVVDNGSELSILGGTHSYPTSAVNLLDGSLLRLHGSGIPAAAVTGMLNATLAGRGIMWGAS